MSMYPLFRYTKTRRGVLGSGRGGDCRGPQAQGTRVFTLVGPRVFTLCDRLS